MPLRNNFRIISIKYISIYIHIYMHINIIANTHRNITDIYRYVHPLHIDIVINA